MKRNQIKRGDFIEKENLTAAVLDPNWKNLGVKVSIDGTKVLILNDWLDEWNVSNPIKNNRIVSDKTFAVRFKNFIEKAQIIDACAEDEKEYLLNIANRLLEYQISTAISNDEINYLKRLDLI